MAPKFAQKMEQNDAKRHAQNSKDAAKAAATDPKVKALRDKEKAAKTREAANNDVPPEKPAKASKASKAEKPAKAEKAPKEPKASDSRKIKLLVKENPKRGTAATRFDLYKNGMTVAEYVAAGGTARDVAWDSKQEFIELK